MRSSFSPSWFLLLAVYGGMTLLLVALPLVQVLHAESSALTALVAFFAAGTHAVYRFDCGDGPGRVLRHNEAALLLPLAGLTVSMLWAPNCAYLTGLMLYGLFPGVTVVLAVGVAYALTGFQSRHPYRWMAGLGVALALGGPVYDLGFHPQFYTYNHVFGGVLGPIYDEQVALRPGLFAFRGLTLLWAAVAFALGARWRGRGGRRLSAGIALGLLAIGGIYAAAAPLGLNTTEAHTQRHLGGHLRTAHFDIHYAPGALSSAQVRLLATDQERHYADLAKRLALSDAQRPERIAVYLYPSPSTKAALTGARATSVAPVWLPTPQIHMLQSRHAAHFRHELAHIVARPFGLPGLKASWAVGLVEGWAVALEAPDAPPSPHALVAAAASSRGRLDGGVAALGDAVAARLSPFGFWTGRGAVSYTTMGSFVRFLLDRYGPEPLKAVYATASFEAAYGQPLEALTDQWARFLASRPTLSRSARAVVTAQFSQPSLFETTCPHYVPPARRYRQAASRALAAHDTSAALSALGHSLAAAPRYVAAQRMWARVQLARGHAAVVQTRLDTLDRANEDVGLLLARADAASLLGQADTARRLYARAVDRLPRYAVGAQAALMLRDAVAHRPDVVRVLVSGNDATQAQRLSEIDASEDAVRAWEALRWMAAGHPERALRHWRALDLNAQNPRPPLWTRTLQLAQLRWHARAAALACETTEARAIGQQATHAFRRYGHLTLTASMRAIAEQDAAVCGSARVASSTPGAALEAGGWVPGKPQSSVRASAVR